MLAQLVSRMIFSNVILREYRSIFAVARMEKIEKEKAAKQNKGQEMNTNMTDAQRLVEPNQNTCVLSFLLEHIFFNEGNEKSF